MSSIFQAEASAIIKACNYVSGPNKTVILTDSLSTVRAIGSAEQNDAAILHIKDILNEKKNIIISWIPSHVGIRGNEKADMLANESHLYPDETVEEINVVDMFNHFKNVQIQHRQERWSRSDHKLLFIRKDIKNKVATINRSRKDQVFLSRLRIGHTLETHSYLLNKTPQPGCIHCQQTLSVKHILIKCQHPSRLSLRKKFKLSNVKLDEILNPKKANLEYLRSMFLILS